jgi:hypothetical protein
LEVDSPALGFLLHEVARLLRRRFEQNARGSGLTRSQWQVLTYLAQNEGINQARLAELIEIEPITLGRIADKLETLMWITRNPHPTDRRRRLLHLMPAAQQTGTGRCVRRYHPQGGIGWRVRSRQAASVEDVAGAEGEPDRSMRSADRRIETSKPWLIEKIS